MPALYYHTIKAEGEQEGKGLVEGRGAQSDWLAKLPGRSEASQQILCHLSGTHEGPFRNTSCMFALLHLVLQGIQLHQAVEETLALTFNAKKKS